MTNRDEYDRYWAKVKSGPPGQHPTGPHHRANLPHPDFQALCGAADAAGITVGLLASDEVFEADSPTQYRHLRAIELRAGNEPIGGEAVTAGRLDLDIAASSLLAGMGRP